MGLDKVPEQSPALPAAQAEPTRDGGQSPGQEDAAMGPERLR